VLTLLRSSNPYHRILLSDLLLTTLRYVNTICKALLKVRNLSKNLKTVNANNFYSSPLQVHFYNIDPNLAQPQMVIVPDVADMFMPILDGFFVPREEAMTSIENLMAQIPVMFADTKETEGALGAAIQGGMEALKVKQSIIQCFRISNQPAI